MLNVDGGSSHRWTVPQERMAAWLLSVKLACDKKGLRLISSWTSDNVMKVLNMGTDVTRSFEYLLATGNLSSKSGTAAAAP